MTKENNRRKDETHEELEKTNSVTVEKNAEPLIFIPSDESSSLFDVLRTRMGWTDEFFATLNDPSYDELKDLPALIARLKEIHDSGELIVVMPDFDMDGISSGTLGYAGLAELGFNVGLYVPDFRRGHDITPDAVDELVSNFPSVSSVITCDGGVNSHEGIGRGKELGLTMLVTDHHVQLDQHSPADIIVNPARIDETYAHPNICGAFVLWQVLAAYAREYAPHKTRDIDLLKLFAGLGTVSDVMPLLYENRQIVRDSVAIAKMLYVPLPAEDSATEYDVEDSVLMSLLRNGDHAAPFVGAFEGFALTLRAFREHGPLVPVLDEDGEQMDDDNGEPLVKRTNGKLRSPEAITEEFYAFYMAPAFNAIRRVGGSMDDAFGAFNAPTTQEKFAAAKAIIDINEERKRLVEVYMDEIMDRDQPYAPWAWLTSAPTGMMGLLAARLMNESGLPVLVIGDQPDPAAPRGGSARAPMWFDMVSTMVSAGFTAVGHEQACGVRMRDESELDKFVAHLAKSVELIQAIRQLDPAAAASDAPDMRLGSSVDSHGPLDDIDELLDMALILRNLRPFGHGFPVPEFEVVLNLASCRLDVIGSDATHLRITTQNGLKLLWWGEADRIDDLRERATSPVPGESVIRLRTQLSVNTFRGNDSPQMTVSKMVGEPS